MLYQKPNKSVIINICEIISEHLPQVYQGWLAHPKHFFLAVIMIVIWLMLGEIFAFSDTWQLFINTLTTIITFLMVFLIQNTQNRDTKAIQMKLDELLRSTKSARNEFIDIERMSDEQLELMHEEFEKLHNRAEKELNRRRPK